MKILRFLKQALVITSIFIVWALAGQIGRDLVHVAFHGVKKKKPDACVELRAAMPKGWTCEDAKPARKR